MITTEAEELEQLLLFIDQDKGLTYTASETKPVTEEQRLRFNLLVDELGLRRKLDQHFFVLGSYEQAQAKIMALEKKYLPSPKQIRLAFVMCRKAGIRNSLASIKKMNRLQVERVIAEANNLLGERRQASPVPITVGKKKNVSAVLEQHESFRRRYKPVRPFSVSDHEWNTWLSQKPDSIIGWDDWIACKPVGQIAA